MRSNRRSLASARLRSWARWVRARMIRTPSLVRRPPASAMRRARTSLASDGERATSKRSCTAEETLLTFCPPGPDASTKLSESSFSSTVMPSVTTNRAIKIAPSIRETQHLFGALEGKLLCLGDGLIAQRAFVDIEAGAQMGILRHGFLRALIGERDDERKRRIVEREGGGARHCARHVGDAIMYHVVELVGWVRMRRGTGGFRTAALIDRDIDENRAFLHRFDHGFG